MKHRIGIYSGAFDPIHKGHIAFALEAMRECGLDGIVLLPEAQPRDKPSVSPLAHRVDLINLAIADEHQLSVFIPSSKQFTVKQTLPELMSHFNDNTLTLLLGSDVLRTFAKSWDNLQVLLTNVHLAIGLRGHDTTAYVQKTVRDLEKEYGVPITYHIVEAPHKHVSSSAIRKVI